MSFRKVTLNYLDPNMLIALCSALHFKGSWEEPFDAPYEGDFHLDANRTKKTQLMIKKSKFAFAWDDDLSAQVVEESYVKIFINESYDLDHDQ